jgi:hypothetical protein
VRDSDPRKAALTMPSSNCKLQTRPLVRDCDPHHETCYSLTVIKIWSWAPDGYLTPSDTGRLIVGRKITSASVASREQLRFSRGDQLQLKSGAEARDSSGTQRGEGMCVVRSRYQATAVRT